LDVGEAMRFDNGFHVELVDPIGAGATEVLVDPRRRGPSACSGCSEEVCDEGVADG
jgi:hypothetical protein